MPCEHATLSHAISIIFFKDTPFEQALWGPCTSGAKGENNRRLFKL